MEGEGDVIMVPFVLVLASSSSVFGEFDIRSIENLNLLYFLLFMINQIRAFLRLSGVKVMSLANY